MPKRIRVTSTFPAEAQAIWRRLSDIATLRFIARPMMAFAPAGDEADRVWREGGSYAFKLRAFGFIPFGGVHSIHVERMDPTGLILQTCERNAVVRVWNHRIELSPQGDETRYTDIVEIDAGVLTPLIALWSRAFYRHRQKRWLRLLKQRHGA